jgi:hypothetical protein
MITYASWTFLCKGTRERINEKHALYFHGKER